MATHRLTAEVSSQEQAREAISHLSRHGVDGRKIKILDAAGQPPREAGRQADRETDQGVANSVGHRLLRAIPVGAALGATLGTVAALLLFDWPTELVLVTGTGGGILVGSILGLVWGLALTPEMGEEWEDTHRLADEARCLVVVTDLDAEQAAEARVWLEDYALWVEQDSGP